MALTSKRGSGLGNLSSLMSQARRTGGARGGSISLTMEPSGQKIEMGFEKWADMIDDFEPIADDVVRIFRKHEHDHFRTQGKQTGPRWPRVNEANTPGGAAYKRWKDRHYPGRPTMVLTGSLRGALVKGGRGSIGGKRGKRGKGTLEVGVDPSSDVGKYAAAHQFALGPAYRIQRKPRPPVRFDPTVHDAGLKSVGKGGTVPLGTAIAQLFQAYIVKARKQGGVDGLFVDNYKFIKMRRGVMRLKTR